MGSILKKYKKFIIAAVVIVVLFFVYSQFFAGRSGDEALLVSEGVDGTNSDVTRELLATLLEIRSITLNEAIFSDEGFRALVDFSQEVPPEPIGRPNPFLPIGSDAVPAQETPDL